MENVPANSRVFVLCSKTATEADLEERLSRYGTIQSARIIRDKETQTSKGIGYVKYTLASAAALAIEQESDSGELFCGQQLRVSLAEMKGTRRPPGAPTTDSLYTAPDELPARSRLFVVCPRTITEDDLRQVFSQFDELEYCRIMKARQTNESKGCAYVKYKLASSAAKAMEALQQDPMIDGKPIKVLLADPKRKNGPPMWGQPHGSHYGPVSMHPSGQGPNRAPLAHRRYEDHVMPHGSGSQRHPAMFMRVPAQGGHPNSRNGHGDGMYMDEAQGDRLFVVCSKALQAPQFQDLFMRLPGYVSSELKIDKSTGYSKGFGFVTFAHASYALHGMQQLDGYDYPPGSPLRVMMAKPKPEAHTHTEAQQDGGAPLSNPGNNNVINEHRS